jgi:hypothetical protein
LIWEHPEAQCRITFGLTGRTLDHYLHSGLADRDADSEDDAAQEPVDFTLLLEALGTRDSLDLKRHSIFLRSIYFFADERQFLRLDHEHGLGQRDFDIFDEGSTLIWRPQEQTKLLMDLPQKVLKSICSHFTLVPEGIIVNLDTHTAHGLDLSSFRVFREFRPYHRTDEPARLPYGPLNAISMHVPLEVEMTSTTATTDFNGFSQLNDIMTYTQPDDVIG